MDRSGAQVRAVRPISVGDGQLGVFVLVKPRLLLRLSVGCFQSLLLLHIRSKSVYVIGCNCIALGRDLFSRDL